ncbi:MAG: TRAP transporter small permease subunit [Actinophytocola sp.]|nr:TRAP transporter small permease subunit [Actinophytocola sp.]
MATGPMKLLRRLRQGLLWISRAAWIMAALGIGATMVIIVYDVLARYVLGEPSEWVFQSASSGLLAISFLALPELYARDDHISVDLVFNHLRRPVRVAAGYVVRAVAVIFGATLLWYGADLVMSASTAGLRTPGAFSYPVAVVSAPMAVGGGLLALVALVTPAPAIDTKDHVL